MTFVKVQRKDVLSQKELEDMIKRADSLKCEYFRLRAKALIALFASGKRREEVASLTMDDLYVDGEFLYVRFTVVKKRKRQVITKVREKKYPLKSRFTQFILDYWNWMRRHHPECKYLFPSVTNVFGQALAFHKDKHLSGRQILNIIKDLNPKAWCHLFRETRAANVIRADQARGRLDIFTVYKVMFSLDLERESTAWNYIRRYASEIVSPGDDIIRGVE